MPILPPAVIRLKNEVFPKIKPSVGPVFFAQSLEIASGNVVANGSFGLVDTGKRKLLVTCHHIIEDFRKLQRDQSNLMLCLALGITPDVLKITMLIDEDKDLDIATFDITSLLASAGERKFFPINYKEKVELKKNDVLFVVGYPGRHRVEFDKAIYWGTTPFLFGVADVTERSIYVNTERMVTLARQRLSEIHENPYGGVSGSLCFALEKT